MNWSGKIFPTTKVLWPAMRREKGDKDLIKAYFI